MVVKQQKQTKKKLKVSQKAIVKQGKPAMSGCGKNSDASCGISIKYG